MVEGLYKEIREKMDKTIDVTERDFGRIRTSRATPALLDGITCEAYGAKMPIIQLATISVPQPRILKIQPFDKQSLSQIERAIMTSDLGILPRNDGTTLTVELPTLTRERREELAKQVGKKGEEMKVAIRNVRREGNDEIKLFEDEKEITEDELERGLKKIQEITDDYIKKVDELVKKKEKEIMEF